MEFLSRFEKKYGLLVAFFSKNTKSEYLVDFASLHESPFWSKFRLFFQNIQSRNPLSVFSKYQVDV
jgi:hypothetical protein